MERETDGERQVLHLEEQAERFAALFNQVQRALGANFKRLPQHGAMVSMTQFMVLGLLQRAQQEGGEPYTIGLLANRLDLDPATVVRAVDSLERRGLVIRRRDQQDRRQVFVEFTDSGKALRQHMAQQMKEQLKAVFSLMSEEGRVALLRGLEELAGVIAERAEREGETHGRHGC
ncbi:MAG: MarR family transcriptional regulator [Thermogemmatispora sp.]|uniref:MarR family winged helix-turn-helix transcriptional regulator n=1 Tax=Thermogemmatispora sp. TaxID=1968838 RepID=UPI001D9075DC|nr:MarR family transcriptional regulator [Thermogemmatispora sp.]MBX5451666.1 MarR family transcriptional regulator [Thermogemmatispora sp.]